MVDGHDPLLLSNTDIWMRHIMPFIGVGRSIILNGICRQTRTMNEGFIASLDDDELPLVQDRVEILRNSHSSRHDAL
jgi:hypothetical protein